jgi:hypothetical protein
MQKKPFIIADWLPATPTKSSSTTTPAPPTVPPAPAKKAHTVQPTLADTDKHFDAVLAENGDNDFDIVLQRIESAGVDIAPLYPQWLQLGFALCDSFGESGREYFHRLSKQHGEYDVAICDDQYNRCLKSKKSGVTIKTFFQFAKDKGIDVSVRRGLEKYTGAGTPSLTRETAPAPELAQAPPAPEQTPKPPSNEWLAPLLAAYQENGEEKIEQLVICHDADDAETCKKHDVTAIFTADLAKALTKTVYYTTLKKYAENIYYIPTPKKDCTVEICNRFIEIRAIELPTPDKFSKYINGQGADFAHLSFGKLLQTAMPFQFWENVGKERKLSINTEYLINMVVKNGFHTYLEGSEAVYIRKQKNVITRLAQHTQQVRAFALNFTKQKSPFNEVRNFVANSTLVSKSRFEDLPTIEIDFTDFTEKNQYYFFKNCTVEVQADKIITHANNCAINTWEHAIIPHDFKRLPPAFTADANEFLFPENIKSHYGRFVLNTSRLHWRKELEERATGNAEDDAQYFADNRFSLNGLRLTPEEITEQLRNFAAKCYTIGYMLHRHKSKDKTWAVWVLEDTVVGSKEAQGGTGKSALIECLQNLIEIDTYNARNAKLTDKNHLFEKVTDNTRLLLLNDAREKFNFDFFYDIITGGIEVNPKNKASRYIDFYHSPKMVITSNYPPPNYNDASTARRIQFCVMTDWYHKPTENNDYREERRISDDFGYSIMSQDSHYTADFWNEDYNFLLDCLQFYLQCSAQKIRIEPPMSKINQRINRSQMGDDFTDWADVYFADDSGNFNISLLADAARNDFITATSSRPDYWKPKRFTIAMRSFCKLKGYTLNPPEVCNTKDGRIMQRDLNGKLQSFYYVKK